MRQSLLLRTAIVIFMFLLAYYGRRTLHGMVEMPFSSTLARTVYYYLWWIVPMVLTIGLLFGFRNILKELGLHRGAAVALVFSTVTVSPMFIGSALMGSYARPDLGELLQSTLVAGFMEELFFRGFLFGMLFRKCGWGFVPASVLGALLFGLGHIYQGNGPAEVAGIFLITAMGATWFAWLYVEWNDNLWVPVFLHVLMNLSWGLFQISDNAMGGIYANIFRAATIALTVIITVRHHRTNGLVIRRQNLWSNSSGR